MGSKHEKGKKTPTKDNMPRKAQQRAGPVDRKNGQRNRDEQELGHETRDLLRPASGKNRVVFYPKPVKDNLRLAKEFYWCDERSFYEMQVPFDEAKQFALASYSFQDADPEIFSFLPRVRRAQEEARRYCAWLIWAQKMGV